MWLAQSKFECPQNLLDKLRTLPRARVAVVNAQSEPVLESVVQAVAEELIDPILIGNLDQIRQLAQATGLDLSGCVLTAAEDDLHAVTLATSMVNAGEANFVMKGHIHTDDFLRGLINKETGIRGEGLMTHVFYMTIPGSDKPLMITDAAINVMPNEKAMKSIIINVIALAKRLGNPHPRVALLSASETPSEAVPSSIAAQSLAEWAQQHISNVDVCGPLALDLAISSKAASLKGVDHPVAGNADILVVPQLETGNALFKALVYYKGACAAGIVMGAKVPVVLTSRADPPEARLASIAIASILSVAAP